MTQSKRILTILKELTTNQKVCTKHLALSLDESERNIQRDIKIIKEFLGDSLIQIERGCYQLLSSSYILDLFKEQNNSNELKNFFEFLSLMDSKLLKFLEGDEFKFIKQIKKDTKEIYAVFENPIEELQKYHFLADMKLAIKDRRYCDIVYNEKEPRDLKNIQPQKIIYAKNNWYLVAMTQNYKPNGGFKMFRINFIDKFILLPKTFHKNLQAQKHIQHMQSLFQNFDQPNYEVKIWVDKEVARHFRVKKYLSSQKIEKDDGDLILTYQVNDDMEIIPLIKTWIPYLKVISPLSLKEKLHKEIKKYISDI